jgi:hypothetical protein
MKSPIGELKGQSLSNVRRYFAALAPPEPGSMAGIHRGIFVGPSWLTPLWPPTLAVSGLGGWWGKQIDAEDEAINLVKRQGRFERRFPMYMVEQTSYLDGAPGRAFRYRDENPFPWPRIVDELRRIDDVHVLGMTLAELGPLRKLGFPFILEKLEDIQDIELRINTDEPR